MATHQHTLDTALLSLIHSHLTTTEADPVSHLVASSRERDIDLKKWRQRKMQRLEVGTQQGIGDILNQMKQKEAEKRENSEENQINSNSGM